MVAFYEPAKRQTAAPPPCPDCSARPEWRAEQRAYLTVHTLPSCWARLEAEQAEGQ